MDFSQLHAAVARYRVLVSRWAPGGRRKEVVAEDKTYSEAQALCEETGKALSLAEPEFAECMCRSVALIELTNKAEVARILGYGPNYCHERAVAAVLELQRQGLASI